MFLFTQLITVTMFITKITTTIFQQYCATIFFLECFVSKIVCYIVMCVFFLNLIDILSGVLSNVFCVTRNLFALIVCSIL